MKNQRASDNRGNVFRVKLARHSLNILARVIGKVSEWEADHRIDGRGPRT